MRSTSLTPVNMTSFDISESTTAQLFSQRSSAFLQHPIRQDLIEQSSFAQGQFVSNPYVATAGLRDPIKLAKVHFRFLVKQAATQGLVTAEKGFQFVSKSVCFTSIDQAFLLWGTVSIIIFSLPQVSTLSWATQAILDAALTGSCIALTSGLTWKVATEANLRWVVFLWAALMTFGMVLTTYSIFGGLGWVLMNLCPLWLSLCTLAYGLMGWRMRSRSFTIAAIVHGISIAGISLIPSWQFFASGLVMAATLFFFSVVPWDMYVPEAPDAGEPY